MRKHSASADRCALKSILGSSTEVICITLIGRRQEVDRTTITAGSPVILADSCLKQVTRNLLGHGRDARS